MMTSNFPKNERTKERKNSQNPKMVKCQHTNTQTHKQAPTHRQNIGSVIFKLVKTKDKEKIMKVLREKRQTTYRGTKIRITAGIPLEELHAITSFSDKGIAYSVL